MNPSLSHQQRYRYYYRYRYSLVGVVVLALMISVFLRSATVTTRNIVSNLKFKGLRVGGTTTTTITIPNSIPARTGLVAATSSSSLGNSSTISTMAESAATQPQPEAPKQLPKLSPSEFRTYNRLAEHMDLFHNSFRHTWNAMYSACEKNQRPAGMSIRQFLNMGLEFCHHLETHHTIEERYVFPNLARKMPQFREQDHLLSQHAEIHKGLEVFEQYLEQCRRGETELRFDQMKKIMDGFGPVLWAHLDDEVKQLGAENMRLFWTKEEMNRLVL